MMIPHDELAMYRLKRARETLEDARLLAGSGRWNPCVNRLYYACFYAVSAILVQEGLSSAKHAGVRRLFNQHFVKTGRVTKERDRLFNDLFERRQEADYMDFVNFGESQVRPWVSEAEAFVESIAGLVGSGRE